MKRIKIFYWTAVFVILDIATICIISGIYIGYVSASQINEIVSVEKWGVKISAPVNTIEKSYISEDGSTVTIHTHSDYDEIIAPGNETNLGHFTVTGTPSDEIEIACVSKIKFENWYIDQYDTEEYCPIVFTIGNDKYMIAYDIDGLSEKASSDHQHFYSDIDELETGVETAIKNMYEQKGTYQNNGDTWDIFYDDVTWKWEYYKSDTYDIYDTILGNREVLPTIDVYISLKIEWDDTVDEGHDTPIPDGNNPSENLYASREEAISGNTVIEDENIPGYTIIEDESIPGQVDTIIDLQSVTAPATGDNFKVVLWISLMVVSATVILVVIVLMVKRRKDKSHHH